MKKVCVVGWPVEHARSPLIHGHWLAAHALDGVYEKRAVAPDDLPTFMRSLSAQGYVGCNVTLPHKEATFALMDDVDAAARLAQAVNTVWLDDAGRLCGSNTDGVGFTAHLDQSAPGWDRSRPVVVLGAGGAARGIIAALLEAGATAIVLINRTPANALVLADLFKDAFPGAITVGDAQAPAPALRDAGLLINTTALGMTGQPPLSIDLAPLPADAVVADIVYAPLRTALLAQAEARGLTSVDGLGMLLHQAVPGFERWFGVRPAVTSALRELVVADLDASAREQEA
ncbi:MAG: shikimate dehydrogenase [Pseudomonadota bacterium]